MANIQKRVYKNGSVKYQALIRLRGQPPQTATFERVTDARKWVSDTESAIRQGRYFKTSQTKKYTLSDAVDKYLKEILPAKRPSTRRDQTHQLEWWVKCLGSSVLAEITTAVLTEAKRKLETEPIVKSSKNTRVADDENAKHKLRSKSTVTAYLAALSHLFSVAIKEWQWVERNPMLNVKKPGGAKGRARFLSDDERTKLLTECKKYPDLNLAVMLSLTTGARKEEIWSMRWSQVSIKNAMITLHQTKNGEKRGLPLVGEALVLLAERQLAYKCKSKLVDVIDSDKKDPFVFAGRKDNNRLDLRKQWEAAIRSCGIKDFRYHDLRHTTASYLAMSGATLGEISEILGHKTLQMVKRYAHFTAGHNAKVLERMTSKMLSSTVNNSSDQKPS